MTPSVFIALCVCGAAGACARWIVDTLVKMYLSPRTHHWGIGLVNLMGCACSCALAGWIGSSLPMILLLSTAFLDGFKTFSTSVVVAYRLIRQKRFTAAVGIVLGVWLGGSALAVVGFLVAFSFAM